MNILEAPLYSLFSADFYRMVMRERLWTGIKYLFYLAGISVLIMTIYLVVAGFPFMNRFIDWAKGEMPVITATAEGLTLFEEGPVTMVHPDLGPVITFDMSKTNVLPADMEEVMIFVTTSMVYIRQNKDNVRTYDLKPLLREQFGGGNPGAIITPDVLAGFQSGMKPWLISLFAIGMLPYFIGWHLILAVFYACVGCFLNISRDPKLTFAELYKISIFAMTASVILEWWIRFIIPGLRTFQHYGWVSLFLTFGYLVFAIYRTGEPAQT